MEIKEPPTNGVPVSFDFKALLLAFSNEQRETAQAAQASMEVARGQPVEEKMKKPERGNSRPVGMQQRGGRAPAAKGTETKRLMAAAQRNLEAALEAEEKARKLMARRQDLELAALEKMKAEMELLLQQGRAKAQKQEQERDRV